MAAKGRLELLDQPERVAMLFGEDPAALEAEPESRVIRLVMQVREAPTGAAPSYQPKLPGKLQVFLNRARERRDYREYLGLRRVVATHAGVERAFCGGLALFGPVRRLILRARGLNFGPVYYDPVNFVVYRSLFVEPMTNYDDAYDAILHVLERRGDYEAASGRRRSARRAPKAPAQPSLPAQGGLPAPEVAREVLHTLMSRRRRGS